MSLENPTIIEMSKAKKPEKMEKTQEELRQALSERMKSIRVSTLNQLDIYEDKLEKGEFDDKEGEPAGSGEKRKLHMQEELLRADKQIDKMKEMLDSGEELPQETINIEDVKTQNQAFLKETFKTWYDEDRSKVEQVPVLVSPKDQDYSTLKDDIDSNKFGEYTLNPDTQNLDFENIPESKILIPDLTVFVGKSFSEVAKHLVDTYSSTHHIPGVEYWKWLIENPTKSPAKLKDGNYYFNFGSLVRVSGGGWCVPSADWVGSGWNRSASRLGSAWDSSYRVVLLEI
jgi:hypothetical protein